MGLQFGRRPEYPKVPLPDLGPPTSHSYSEGGRSLRACVTVSCPPVCLVAVCLEFGFSHLMSSRSVLVVSVRLHFLLKFEQYPTVLVDHSLLCSFIGRQILEWQFGGYRSYLEHFEQPHTCFGGIKFLSLGPPQIKNRSHHMEILGLVFKSPPDWFVLWSLFFALV